MYKTDTKKPEALGKYRYLPCDELSLILETVGVCPSPLELASYSRRHNISHES
jgi:hypothetical protein